MRKTTVNKVFAGVPAFHLVLFCAALMLLGACTDESSYTYGVWYRRSDFDGSIRYEAAGFTIGNKGYICSGYTGRIRLNDLWEYNTEGNYWTQLASMPDEAGVRNGAIGFAIGDKGYVTTGRDNNNYRLDTWEYDPASNTWQQKDDYPGDYRMYAVAFGIGNYGYAGTGYNDISNNNYLKDFYRLDPNAAAGSQWQIVNGFGGSKRLGATAFVIDDIAYICTGLNNGSYVYDFWNFNPATGEWKQLRDIADTDDDDYDDDYTGIVRAYGCSFVIDGIAYLVTGDSGSKLSNYWKYNPATDLWDGEDLTPFEGSGRSGAIAFSTGSRGFVTTGSSGSYSLDDTWELKPYEIEED